MDAAREGRSPKRRIAPRAGEACADGTGNRTYEWREVRSDGETPAALAVEPPAQAPSHAQTIAIVQTTIVCKKCCTDLSIRPLIRF